MKIGDLVYGTSFPSMKRYIGTITNVHHDEDSRESKIRYTVFFPCPPKPYWNTGTWNKKALEVV
jgi:hypothetical protein